MSREMVVSSAMKKIISMILILSLLALSGCGSSQAPVSTEAPEKTEESAQPAVPAEETAPEDAETVSEPEPVQAEEETTDETGSGVLVIYFSRTGEQYGVGVIEKGNTAIVAEMIAEKTGADSFEILPADDHYPMTYNELTAVAKQEQNDRARPAYAGELPDFGPYDTIFIGAPVWWGDWPMIMYTFFESTELSGKTLIPFSTHAGSGLSGFDRSLAAAFPNCTVEKGLAIAGTDAQNNQEKVRSNVDSWLNELGF